MGKLMLTTPESGPCSRSQAFDAALISKATDTYQPLPNKVLVNMIHTVAEQNGLTLFNEELGMDLKGQRFFGVCDIKGKDFFGGRIRMMIGFCNSYNKSMSARMCIGGKVSVCSNRAFHAYTDDFTGIAGMAIHPHYINVHEGLFQRIKEAFEQIEAFRKSQECFYRGLLECEIDDDFAYATIVRAAQAGVINKTKVLTIANEWNRQAKKPTGDYEWHPSFRNRNGYSLFNAFTQIEKERLEKNPVQSHISTMGLTDFFRREFEIN